MARTRLSGCSSRSSATLDHLDDDERDIVSRAVLHEEAFEVRQGPAFEGGGPNRFRGEGRVEHAEHLVVDHPVCDLGQRLKQLVGVEDPVDLPDEGQEIRQELAPEAAFTPGVGGTRECTLSLP